MLLNSDRSSKFTCFSVSYGGVVLLFALPCGMYLGVTSSLFALIVLVHLALILSATFFACHILGSIIKTSSVHLC